MKWSETRPASAAVEPVAIICAAVSIGFCAALLIVPSFFFPRALSQPWPWNVMIQVHAPTRSAALDEERLQEKRLRRFLLNQGFAASEVHTSAPVLTYYPTVDPADPTEGKGYAALQQFSISAHDYDRFARVTNALHGSDVNQRETTAAFPPPPFMPNASAIFGATLLLLLASSAGVEWREADTGRAPRGLHPFVIAVATLLCGGLVAVAITQVHLLFDATRGGMLGFEILGIASLGAWLWKTWAAWNQRPSLQITRTCYLAALLGVGSAAIAAFLTPVT